MQLIDADELREYWLYNGLNEKVYDTNDVLESIDEQPTVDQESLRPTAHWKRIQDVAYMCTYCKSCFAFIPYNYQYFPECCAKILNAYAFARER